MTGSVHNYELALITGAAAPVETRRNRVRSPRGINLASYACTLGVLSSIPAGGGVRMTRNAGGAARALEVILGTDLPAAGGPVTIKGEAMTGNTLAVVIRPTTTSSTGAVAVGNLDPLAGVWQPFEFTITMPFTPGAASGYVFTAANGIAGNTYDFRNLQVEAASAPLGAFFDGSTTDADPATTYEWTGTAEASPSRLLVVPPATIPITLKGGSVTLDQGTAPHVTGTYRIDTPPPDTLALLDPRLGARVLLTVDAVTPAGAQHRTFNLGIRTQAPDQRPAELVLAVASDEALLGDWAPLTDDRTPWTLQTSLLAIVNYVLGKVIPGAVLASTIDADVSAYWDAVNVIINPNIATGAGQWVGSNATLAYNAGAGAAGAIGYLIATSTAAGWEVWPQQAADGSRAYSATPGARYTFGIAIRGPGTQRQAYARLRFYDVNGNPLATVNGTSSITTGSFAGQRTVSAYAPAGTAKVAGAVHVDGASGDVMHLDTAWLAEGEFDPGFFDGSTADTAKYRYDWTENANASATTRTALVDAPAPEAFIWRAGQNGNDFLIPLIQAAGLRLVCDEARVWTLRNEAYAAGGSLSVTQGVNMIEGSSIISRDSDDWYDAAVVEYVWESRGLTIRRLDSYALATPYNRLRLFSKRAVYPGAGFAQYAVRRAQGRGREVSATIVADWRARAEQDVVIRPAGTPTLLGKTQTVTFTLDRDAMTVTARTADAPPGAIDLLAGTINALPGTINGLS